MSNTTSAPRIDRAAVQDDLTRASGGSITRMPRHMRWDGSRGRYTFSDMPHLPPRVAAHGTSAADCSHAGRYLDALTKYVTAVTSALDAPAAARLTDDVALAREQVALLVGRGTRVTHGPLTRAARHVRVEVSHGSCMALLKGATPLLYDERFADEMRDLCVDVSGASPTVRVDGGSGGTTKARLADVVWTRWAGRTLLPGCGAVPLNYETYDVRLDNLIALPGGGKSNRGPTLRRLDAEVDVGMTYLPRGVHVSASNRGGCGGHDVIVALPTGGSNKSTCRGSGGPEALGACVRRAIEQLRAADPSFDVINARYQESARFHEAAMAALPAVMAAPADTPNGNGNGNGNGNAAT